MIKLPIDLKSNKKQAIIFIALLALIALVLYFNILLKPQIKRVTDVLSEMGKIRNDLRTAQSSIGKVDEFKDDISAYKEKVESYEKMLPTEQQIPALLEDLSDMAKNSGIKIIGISPITPSSLKIAKAQKDEVYKEMPILINAKSGYHELGVFLSNLENADRFMKVIDIGIKSNKATPKKHDVDLVVCTYILLEGR